jgi:type II secretory pathway component GspD/PulD (secretin)
MHANLWLVAVLLGASAGAQQTNQAPPANPNAIADSAANHEAQAADSATRTDSQGQPVKRHDKRRAATLYVEASKLFDESQFEPAMRAYEEAAKLDPTNSNYALAAQVARSHAVTALIQAAAKDRTQGDSAASRAALQHARELDPNNTQVAEHLYELSDDVLRGQSTPIYEESAATAGEAPRLEPTPGAHSFHLKTERRQLIQNVYKAYGIDATVDQSVSALPAKLDIDDVTFQQAVPLLQTVTKTFSVPVDAHRVLAAADTTQNRQEFLRQELETVYLPGLTAAEMTEVSNIAKNIFATQQVAVEQTAGAVTLRAPPKTLDAFNATMQDLLNGRSQVMLDVRMIQLAHTTERTTGVQLPQQFTAFNVYTEEQAILNANQALVQQIIASGLAAPGDTLAILGILFASGQVTNPIFSNGFVLFGGGLTLSGLSFAPAKVNFKLNSSDSRALDSVELRLADGEEQTLRSGTRYPIQVASYGSAFASGVNIPGLTTAGNSSGLSSLLPGLSGQSLQIPQVQYQDLGLTLKATPKVMRGGDVALTLDLKLTALAGSVVNGNPVLNNRSYSGVVTLKTGTAAVLVSELSKQESLALTGTPGLTEVPGMDNVTEKDTQKNYASLLIILTPHLVRAPLPAGRSEMMRIERTGQTQ